MEETINQVPTQESYKYVISIRFRNTNKCYSFGTNNEEIEYGDYVVVETARGVELGEVVSPLRELKDVEVRTPLKPVLNKATAEDRQRYAENIELAKEAYTYCQKEIERLQLDMNLISAEYTLDRSKVLFVYVADERVDFRELLKQLASGLHCRIELRQIGSRDKAKIIGGIGPCGMETCCSRFMDEFDVVSINMAKNQLLALNIQKLSGQCGKLMCCLKFEDDAYKELRQGLPKLNAQVEYEGQTYRVTSMNVIAQQAKLENRETVQFISLDDLKNKAKVKKVEPPQPKKEAE
ncbi:PSP1 domain-containing protein [Anaerorhabdus furcosa]|uniref:Cell fate regulator YaaT, PSP1 superfamily (Controls sporulation, competence, biofilm development) n=1 Tax=Anaerorhabdus furcosa TaxID=118967 RepID=A0A1T4KN71_9FIRM|nr:regulatory iron-sulfur-containing complex subunit RicT [Anaerorhabdus furcosa]SJZ43839.1 Cell fate regulator YaaT, PSP1 superfamily (controls sporulation, competence, biofilm development) [Anaerorhabdus furcosa]